MRYDARECNQPDQESNEEDDGDVSDGSQCHAGVRQRHAGPGRRARHAGMGHGQRYLPGAGLPGGGAPQRADRPGRARDADRHDRHGDRCRGKSFERPRGTRRGGASVAVALPLPPTGRRHPPSRPLVAASRLCLDAQRCLHPGNGAGRIRLHQLHPSRRPARRTAHRPDHACRPDLPTPRQWHPRQRQGHQEQRQPGAGPGHAGWLGALPLPAPCAHQSNGMDSSSPRGHASAKLEFPHYRFERRSPS